MTDSLRIAIYARYSSDLQNPSSIADQVALCRSLIEQHFGVRKAVAVYSDAAITGTTMARPGICALIDASDDRAFDMVVAEGLDRISRSLADAARIYEILKLNRVRVWTAHEGEVGDIHVAFKGTMNALFLKDMGDKVRRAHRALAEAGRSTSSVSFGYRAVRGVLDDRGRYVNGLREIDDDQAEIVRRIFQEVADGIPVRSVVRSLNEDGVPAPGGGIWRAHCIRGERTRGRGILNNELYRGWLVYNRTRKVVDPRTGKRHYELNPEHEWRRTHVPELQIVSQDLWDRVQGLRPTMRGARQRIAQLRSQEDFERAGRPLTGLVKCGWCGGQKSIANAGRYVCDTYRFNGRRCRNARGRKEADLAAIVFEDLYNEVELIDDWRDRISAYLAAEVKERMELHAEAGRIEKRITRLLDAVERGVKGDAAGRILDLQDRLAEIRRLPPLPDTSLTTPQIRERIKAALGAMEREWRTDKYSQPIRRLLAMIVDSITLTPKAHTPRGEHVACKATVQIVRKATSRFTRCRFGLIDFPVEVSGRGRWVVSGTRNGRRWLFCWAMVIRSARWRVCWG